MRSTRAPKGIWQGIMRSTRASKGIWQGIMRSTRAPKGQRAPSSGQVSEANDTLGYADGFPMRPRRGQKQRQKRSCHGFCPLRGRIVCASTKPRVSLATLACPGLGACCPCGARVERLSPIGKNSSPEPNDFWACVLLQAGQDAFNERPEEWQGARRSTHAPKGKWQGIMRPTHAPKGKWQGVMR